jgi:IclR family pca regulon transcriptional regulator
MPIWALFAHNKRSSPYMTTKSAKSPSKVKQRDLISSLERGFRVLRVFDHNSVQMTPSEVARKIDVPRAATRRVLLTLCELGYAISDGKHFRLTPKVLDLAHGYLAKTRVRDLLDPLLRETSTAINDSCVLAIRDGDDSITIACGNSSSFGAVSVSPGLRIPLFVSTPGRLLLASLPERGLSEYLAGVKLRRFTQRTVMSKAALHEQIDRIRAQGYALGREEFELGVYALAVPVKSAQGKTIAALGCIGNVAKLVTPDAIESRVTQLTKAAERMIRLLPDNPDFTADLQNSING